jgi:multiple antibiotic resistance protein
MTLNLITLDHLRDQNIEMNITVITEAIEYFLITISAIFVIVNPMTTAFVFMALLPKANEQERKSIARKSVKVATLVFFIFALLGSLIFQLFGITLYAFRIAGGIILFGIAMNMISKKKDKEKKLDQDGEIADIAIIPLAIPFISGPGSIATVMILTSEAPSPYHTLLVFLAIIITTFTCYYTMTRSQYIVKYLGETGKEIITRLFGLILAVIAIQFVINGMAEAYRAFLAGKL